MIIKYLLALFCVSVLVNADGNNEIKKGDFPFMAYIYYPDEAVVDAFGNRFLRGAVLIKLDWLVTSGFQLSDANDTTIGYPNKTLLAVVGAVTIDDKFNADEDDDEQEEEVIQIVRPYNHSATLWWRTDISLMKTRSPFNLTSAVSPINLKYTQDIVDKTCNILVYSKRYSNTNVSEDRVLMKFYVNTLSPSTETCGSYFYAPSMTCAADIKQKNISSYYPQFCSGNSGGPLICESDVVGLQTYINNDCNQPYLYQLISAWKTLISCSTEEKCEDNQCKNVCFVINNDTPNSPDITDIISPENTVNVSEWPKEEKIVSKEASVMLANTMSPSRTTIAEQTITTEQKTTLEIGTETTLTVITVTIKNDGDKKIWANESKSNETTDKMEKKMILKAQQKEIIKKYGNSAAKNICVFKNLISIVILSNLI